MIVRILNLYVMLLSVIHGGFCITKPSTLVLENNQFKGLVIAIHESVTADTSLIDTLKSHMNDASKILLKATHTRAYFKEITLLLPSTWPDDPSYGVATTETLNLADVIITDTVRPTRSLPKTRSYSGCGKQGVHILMSLDFLTKPRAEPYYAQPGKYFVHAFAQFRWGVFQEYAETGESLFYFSLTSGHPEAIRCVYYLRGLVQKNDANLTICYHSIDPHTGIYTPDCMWKPYPTRQRVKASIMDHQWISAIETFCGDDPADYLTVHNYEAPSKHNRLCGHRSTWDIISNSPDFSNGNNPKVNNTSPSDLLPTFTIVKSKARRRRAVLVMDDHTEYHHHQRILGMVARLQRETKSHDLEIVVKGSTEYTKDSNLFSDQDHVIHIRHSCNELDRGVTESLVTTKDGSCPSRKIEASHIAEGSTTGHTLMDRLRETILKDDITNNKYVIIHRDDVAVGGGNAHQESIYIDPTVGQKTLFVFYYEYSPPSITLHSPSGHTLDLRTADYSVDQTNKVIQFYIELAEAGTWQYQIQSENDQHISTLIATTPIPQPHDPVIIRTHVEAVHDVLTLYVDVTQGSHPVIGLNVTAKLEKPTGDVENLPLFDNGAGADNTRHDGVYSRHFTRSATEGIYHVSAKVMGHEGEIFIAEETYEIPEVFVDEDAGPLQTFLTKRAMSGGLQRHVSMGSLSVARSSVKSKFESNINNTLPPSRVVDLKVSRHLYYRNTLVLTWTAPGDDLDHGKVNKYEVYIGCNIKDVRALLQYGDTISSYEGPGSITKETYKPVAMAMETEIYLWKFPSSVKTFSFSVRGVDEAGNSAEMSNVATFGFVQH